MQFHVAVSSASESVPPASSDCWSRIRQRRYTIKIAAELECMLHARAFGIKVLLKLEDCAGEEMPNKKINVQEQYSKPEEARFMESFESRHSDFDLAGRIAKLLGVTKPPLRLDSQVKYGEQALCNTKVCAACSGFPIQSSHCICKASARLWCAHLSEEFLHLCTGQLALRGSQIL